MLQNCNNGKGLNNMNKKTASKKHSKPSIVCRVKKQHEIFYKNLDPKKNDINRGMETGEQLLTKFLDKKNGTKFTQFIMKELDEINDLMAVKYGEDLVTDFFFPISEYYRSALQNGGTPKMSVLESFIKAKKKDGD